jgi:alkaline phosphatase D
MTNTELLLGPLVGDLSHNSVKIWGRTSGEATLHAWLNDGGQVKHVGKTRVNGKTGFAGVVEIKDLAAETWYRYALTLFNEEPSAASFGRFKTAPVPEQPKSFSFAFGSCFYPMEPEPGLTFQRITRMHGRTSFLLMVGDQIYADLWKHNGLKEHIALDKDDYNEVYRHAWSNKHMRELLKNVPVFMTQDDHEVDNDWHWRDSNRTEAILPFYLRFKRWRKGRPPEESNLTHDRVRAALQVYWEHQGMHGPELLLPDTVKKDQVQLEPGKPFSFAYTFTYGSAAFFVMDTRSMRMRGRGKGEVLGNEQWLKLKSWLSEVKDKYPVKFVVTSSAFLHFLLGDYSLDRWSGYPRERNRLMHYLSEHEIEDVYLLTGDLHSGHAISVDIRCRSGKNIPLWEFCASPFEQHSSWLARLLTLRWMPNKLWENYKVHFVKGSFNYGVVNVNFEEPENPKVEFELHYLDKKWKVKKVRS